MYEILILTTINPHRYGLPFVSPHNILVTAINGTGAVIEIIYVLIFVLFAPKKEKAKTLGLFTFVIAVFSAVVFVSLFALHGNSRKIFCGFAAAIFSIIMYGSPLSIMVSYVYYYILYITLWPSCLCSSPSTLSGNGSFFGVKYKREINHTDLQKK